MTGIEAGHIVIAISAEIWPHMKTEFDRINARSMIVSIWYRRQPMFEVVRANDGYTCRFFGGATGRT
jgi:hypothetical protein